MDIRHEAIVAFNRLSCIEQRYIGQDAVAVLRTAIGCKTRDGMIDEAIPRALEHHHITERNEKVQEAYRRYLFCYFLFNTDELVRRRDRRTTGDNNAH